MNEQQLRDALHERNSNVREKTQGEMMKEINALHESIATQKYYNALELLRLKSQAKKILTEIGI